MRVPKSQGGGLAILGCLTLLLLASCSVFDGRNDAGSNQPKNINPNADAVSFNYTDAFAKSILYYESSWCGPDAGQNRLKWRGPCHTNDGADIGLDLTGGFHDAGDHVKFGLPQVYAASTLGWAYYDFKDAFVSKGQDVYMLAVLKHFSDYFLKCLPNKTTFHYQVGDGTTDHSYWGPPELQKTSRPVLFSATTAKPASDVCGSGAAALAQMAAIYADKDSAYAARCLAGARDLYNFGKANRGLSDSGGFYGSTGYLDDLSWGAIWLYIATKELSYLTDVDGFMAEKGLTGANGYQNHWTHCWDDVYGGVFVKLAQVTSNVFYKTVAEENLTYWMTQAPRTAAGECYINSWGALRYTAAECFMALSYYKTTGNTAYRDFAKGQIDYMLGANPRSSSYVVGFGNNFPKFPHHRAASGRMEAAPAYETKNDPEKHILYGALIGGPKIDDTYIDDINQYDYTEVAIDYNAGFVGAMAGLALYYGAGQTPEATPGIEPATSPYYVDARVMRENNQSTVLQTFIHNDSVLPPHYEKGLSYRYFVDLSEYYANGLTAADVIPACYYGPANGSFSKLIAWDEPNHVYYVEVNWPGSDIYGKVEFQLAMTAYNSSVWSPLDDYSRIGLTTNLARTDRIPVYRDGVLISGVEPPKGNTSSKSSAIVSSTSSVISSKISSIVSSVKSASSLSIASSKSSVSVSSIISSASSKSNIASSSSVGTSSSTAAGGLKVQFYNGSTAVSGNQIYGRFLLVNTTSASIALSGIKIRYYYTKDGTQNQNFWCDWSPVGTANVTGTFGTVSPAKVNADSYLEIGFSVAAGSIAPNATLDIQTRTAKTDWSNYNQSNDYSFNATATSYVDWNKVTAYQSGSLKWGIEP